MLTVNRRIWLGFSLMLVLLVVMATVGFRALQRATAGYEAVIARSNLRDDPAVPDAHAVDDWAEREVVGVAILAFLVGIVSATTLSRSINRMLGETTTVLASSASEILASTTEQAASGSESMAAVAETAATVDQVAQASDQANQRAKTMSEAAQRAADIGKAGRKAVDDSVTAMGHVRIHVDSIAAGITSLSQQAQAIADVIASADEIAEQTNLLALNAAIEAARAGDEGSGFRVVAGEIRRLAEQSKKATVQVRQILGDIQRATTSAVLLTEQGTQQVQAGVKQVGEAGETIRSLTDVVAQSAQVSAQILASSSQQSAGMSQIRQAMVNIQEATQQNVAASQQNERAARDLTELGNKLLALIGAPNGQTSAAMRPRG
jgi:methyl-accepting chemotaxis protein